MFGRFLGIGFANTVLTFLLYELLIIFMPYRPAYTLSFVVGIVFALLTNARVVFLSPVTVRSAVFFVVLYLANYAAGLVLIGLLVEIVQLSPKLAPIGVIAIMVPINFIATYC